MDTYKIIISGFGGQGILLIGKLLTYAANIIGKHTSWLPSYGPEMRGGSANCMVVISNKPINSPLVSEPTTLVAMNRPSLDKFEPKIKEGGLLFINEDAINREIARKDIEVIKVPADTIAYKLGSNKVANMVMLGAYLGYTELIPLEVVVDNLKKAIPQHRHHLLGLNEEALKEGYKIGSENRVSGKVE